MTLKTKNLLAAALCVLTLCSITACAATIGTATEAPETAATAAASAESLADGSTQIANPFREVGSLAEAAEIVGFEISVPEAPASHPDTVIRVLESSSLVEVLYVNAANETEEGQDELYRIRKAPGTEDISGDYGSYPESRASEIEGRAVTLRGNGENWSVAVWAENGYTYAVDAQDHPLSLEEMTEIIGAVK